MIKNNKISEQYIAGFVDGEGCFALSIRRDIKTFRKSQAVYYSWKACFAISIRADDNLIIMLVKEKLKCGTISFK